MNEELRFSRLDLAASVGVGVFVTLIAIWGWMEASGLKSARLMFAEMEGAELPMFSELMWELGSGGVFHIVVVALALASFGLLFRVKDRLRANVYALIPALLIASTAIMMKLALTLPLMKIIQQIGQ